jgi:hypothetical protein
LRGEKSLADIHFAFSGVQVNDEVPPDVVAAEERIRIPQKGRFHDAECMQRTDEASKVSSRRGAAAAGDSEPITGRNWPP